MTTNGAPRSPVPSRALNVADLRKAFSGVVITPADDRYDDARTVWNAMVDKRPAVIVRPESARDVVTAIAFARRADLEIGVRGGGHSVTGMAVPEDGLMIDLSSMGGVKVDTDRRRALVGGGALLGELDRAAQAHGLATTAGNVSVTGVGGLTLGGGMGWLARQFGLACDNVVGAEVVTADGSIVRTNATSDPDLFWAIRGGGGNFGVVTEFEFRLYPMTGSALVVDFFYDLDQTSEVLRTWRELGPVAPPEATYTAWVGNAPPWPFLPKELHGRLLGNAGFVWIGDPDEGRRLIPSLRSVAEPVAQSIEEMTYLELQTSGDATNQPGNRRYWKGRYLRELSDTAIDAFLGRDVRARQPEANGMLSAASMQVYGGAIADPPDGDNAFSQRDAVFEVVTSVSWSDPAEDDARMRGARTVASAIEPFASGAYVNSLSDEGESGVEIAYGSDRLQRLGAIKDRYDPENVFHLNHNVRPTRALASTR
jgi:FAD/FMN-containing dehydrogenase